MTSKHRIAATAILAGGISRHGAGCYCRYCTEPATDLDPDVELANHRRLNTVSAARYYLAQYDAAVAGTKNALSTWQDTWSSLAHRLDTYSRLDVGITLADACAKAAKDCFARIERKETAIEDLPLGVRLQAWAALNGGGR